MLVVSKRVWMEASLVEMSVKKRLKLNTRRNDMQMISVRKDSRI